MMESKDRICQVCFEHVPEGEESCPNCGTYLVPMTVDEGSSVSQKAENGITPQIGDQFPERLEEAVLPPDNGPRELLPAIEDEVRAQPVEQEQEVALPAIRQRPADSDEAAVSLSESTAKPNTAIKSQADQPEDKDSSSPPKTKQRAPSEIVPPPAASKGDNKTVVRKSGESEKKQQPKSNRSKRSTSCVLIIILACVGLAYIGYLISGSNNLLPDENSEQAVIIWTATSPAKATRIASAPKPTSTRIASTSKMNPTTLVTSLDGCTIGDLRIRSGPSDTTETAGWVVEGVCLVFEGRDQDGVWVHIAEGQETNSGWVVLRFVDLQGDVFSLPIIADTESLPGD